MNNNLDSSSKVTLQSYFQAKRLIQVFWAVESTLVFILIQRIYLTEYYQSLLVVFVGLSLTSVYRFAKQNKVIAGTSILLSIMTIFVTYFMWANSGIHDEVVLAYPCLLLMAAMLGNKKLFASLLTFITLSILANGIANHFQWHVNIIHNIGINHAILMLLIIFLISYTIWIMAADFRTILQKLSQENSAVIQSKKAIEKLIHHDVLTGLPNRTMAQEVFKKAVYQAKRDNLKVALLFIDLDNFKLINDGLGHQAGDELLQELSIRLKNTVRESDTVCRFAGDEFIVIIESITDDELLARIAQNIIEAIQQPYNYQCNELISGCSIGITVSPNDGSEFDTLIRNADTAMYHSKSIGGSSFHFFDSDMNSHGHEYLNIVTDLRKALKEKQFVLFYQPKIDLSTNKVIGAEALIRWQHPIKGMIFPDFFIPQAEKSGLIVEIGEWVLEQACNTCKSFVDHGLNEFTIAVNASSQQFKRGNFSQIVQTILTKTELEPRYLEIEMTESLLIENSTDLKNTVKYLRNLGVSFSIDDFGTGYSNLGYLKEFEIESLKIDRSFVHDIMQNPKNKALVKAIIQMAKGLDLLTIAEGIENDEIAKELRKMKCDYAQGYYWSKAISENDFIEFVKNKRD